MVLKISGTAYIGKKTDTTYFNLFSQYKAMIYLSVFLIVHVFSVQD
jgi:hypothetical protein